ncbi:MULTISPECIES: hypothetical protein [unclassified Streptomyces]|uniref:hypothetical protein n=1 Tax=unclassified Streptomyces TaxID=2593676 RepID=UPI002E163077|nr:MULTISPECIES: hypothetical protein [unclassified Streptomyces]WSR26155.1 hypothetical protein OG573_08395 [Streptomyces sp. NBC_01205]
MRAFGISGTAETATAVPPQRTANTLFWTALIPTAATVGGFVSQYPYGMLWVGVLIVLAAAAAGPIVAGSVWRRAGAATLVGFAALALGLFAGSNLNETYVKQLGERTGAVVAEAGERANAKGDVRHFCRVVDDSGSRAELGDIQNCHGQFATGRRVVLFKDRLGGLDPWIEATHNRAVDPVGLGITGGLFLLTAATMFYAGRRRR